MTGTLLELVPHSTIVAEVIDGSTKAQISEGWRSSPFEFHVARTICHLAKLANGDTSEQHFEIAAARLMMALELRPRQ
jgi:hypothetical protein